MTKLCPRGKAAAKRKFAVYPSAYANAYASKICAGKIKDPSGKKRKDFKGPKPAGKAKGGRIYKADGGLMAFEGRKFRDKQIRQKQTRDRRRAAEKFPGPKREVGKGRLRPKFKSGGLAKKGRGCEIR